MSNSLRPHELQHARSPCPSPTLGVYSNPCPLSQWCHPTISSSVVPFFSCLQSFQMSQLFASGGQNIGVSILIFFPAILIPACASSSPAFFIYSAYKLNKHGDNTQPWRTLFPILNQSVVPCLVLTVASWPAYRFLKGQVRSHLCIYYWNIISWIKLESSKKS